MFLYLALMGGAFLTVVFLFLGLSQAVYGQRAAVLERLKASTAENMVLRDPAAGRSSRNLRLEVLNFLGSMGNFFPRGLNRKTIQQKLIQARIFMRAEEFIGLSLVVALGAFLLIYLLSGNIFVAVPAGLLFFKVPALFVEMKKRSCSNMLMEQLPEALGIISSGLRAGFSFLQAMAVVSKEMESPIKEEFARVIRENRMGKTLEESLQALSERADSEDLDLFITALLIQKQVGGNLAEILDNISHTIRERIRIKGEIRTLTTQGRLSATIIILLPIFLALFMFFFNPEYIMLLFQEPLGLFMLVSAVALQVAGIFIIRKIITIDV